mmetsp:Transcript_45110/g.88257  ORF Transcript_45110/g.88257 Transcript_45110/m.88257 type:complete len:82 (+) Transcript_45110:1774-2019(+)
MVRLLFLWSVIRLLFLCLVIWLLFPVLRVGSLHFDYEINDQKQNYEGKAEKPEKTSVSTQVSGNISCRMATLCWSTWNDGE